MKGSDHAGNAMAKWSRGEKSLWTPRTECPLSCSYYSASYPSVEGFISIAWELGFNTCVLHVQCKTTLRPLDDCCNLGENSAAGMPYAQAFPLSSDSVSSFVSIQDSHFSWFQMVLWWRQSLSMHSPLLLGICDALCWFCSLGIVWWMSHLSDAHMPHLTSLRTWNRVRPSSHSVREPSACTWVQP